MASRAADPARIVAAVEEAQARGIPSTPDRFRRRRRRWVKSRNSRGYTVEVVARHADRTTIEIRAFTRYNFRRAGDMPARVEANAHYTPVHGIGRVVRSRPNPAIGKTINRIPAEVTVADMMEVLK